MNIKYRGYPKGTCRHCGVTEDQDYMTLQDFGNFDIDFSHPADSDRCVITYTDGTQGRVNQDGIIEDICPVNVLLQKEERVAVCQ
jgi:hypothetical protein